MQVLEQAGRQALALQRVVPLAACRPAWPAGAPAWPSWSRSTTISCASSQRQPSSAWHAQFALRAGCRAAAQRGRSDCSRPGRSSACTRDQPAPTARPMSSPLSMRPVLRGASRRRAAGPVGDAQPGAAQRQQPALVDAAAVAGQHVRPAAPRHAARPRRPTAAAVEADGGSAREGAEAARLPAQATPSDSSGCDALTPARRPHAPPAADSSAAGRQAKASGMHAGLGRQGEGGDGAASTRRQQQQASARGALARRPDAGPRAAAHQRHAGQQRADASAQQAQQQPAARQLGVERAGMASSATPTAPQPALRPAAPPASSRPTVTRGLPARGLKPARRSPQAPSQAPARSPAISASEPGRGARRYRPAAPRRRAAGRQRWPRPSAADSASSTPEAATAGPRRGRADSSSRPGRAVRRPRRRSARAARAATQARRRWWRRCRGRGVRRASRQARIGAQARC